MPEQRPDYLQAYDAAKYFWVNALPVRRVSAATHRREDAHHILVRLLTDTALYDQHPLQAEFTAQIAHDSVIDQIKLREADN